MARALFAATGVGLAGTLAPDDADAYHFCGHIYTTGSCPHPRPGRQPTAKGAPDADLPQGRAPPPHPHERGRRLASLLRGHVRKLMDCCSYSSRRINGDAALTGYCYSGRKVVCVMYHQTKVPC